MKIIFILGLCGACSAKEPAGTASHTDGGLKLQTASITASVGSTRFDTRDAFLAGAEMQISGEPFAEAMGRDLGGYSRDHVPTDIYFDRSPGAIGPWIDLPGFSTGVESYEYSKQPMNNIAFESGAGTSLVYGPLVNPDGRSGAEAVGLLADRIQHFAEASHAFGRFVFPAGTYPADNPRNGNRNSLAKGKPADNPLGWPGIWPTAHVFRSFDPAIDATSAAVLGCTISSDDDPGATGSLVSADYECDATSLHLPNRDQQVDKIVSPGADGFSAWKYGLWVINYLQVMHDSAEAPVAEVDDAALDQVGSVDNQVVGRDNSKTATKAGTYLGSSDIEGFQAALFIEELDDRAEDWLMHLGTSDGKALSGFASLDAALAYDYETPLRWFPAAVKVTETDDGSGFLRPAYSLSSPDTHLLDLLGMVLGYSEIYALTDTANAGVGGSEPARAYFDGDPFPADDQKADGEPTLHDRALGVLRVALVDLDRLHVDPASDLLVDDVTMKGASPSRGATVSTTSVAYSILALRNALRSLSSQLQLYSNNKPDTAIGKTPFDALPGHPPPGGTLIGRMQQILRAEAGLLFDHLTDESGRAWDGWDVEKGSRLDDHDLLDAHTAAERGLFAAYLATGDVRYRERAIAVFNRLQGVFYDADARIYDATPAPTDSVEYTPLRFALLSSALRDMYELVAVRPEEQALEPLLESRVGRLDKLVLNGWDDRDENRLVDWPDECVVVLDGLPRGGLEMAERTLTGETGSKQDQFLPGQRNATSDRDHDCVPEVDDAKLPAALAGSVTFHIHRSTP